MVCFTTEGFKSVGLWKEGGKDMEQGKTSGSS